MMQAFAADSTVHHAGAFYDDPTFWVMIAFIITVAVAFRPAVRMITTALDKRAETISNQIDEATRLRDEAQELLASFQRKQRDAVKEAEQIVANAEEDAKRLAVRAAENLERALERREQAAMERIAQAEAKALAEVQSLAVDVALDATRRLLSEQITGAKANAMIDAAIKDLPGKIH
jgi:F-type H+-transporting ATPase subunit b